MPRLWGGGAKPWLELVRFEDGRKGYEGLGVGCEYLLLADRFHSFDVALEETADPKADARRPNRCLPRQYRPAWPFLKLAAPSSLQPRPLLERTPEESACKRGVLPFA